MSNERVRSRHARCCAEGMKLPFEHVVDRFPIDPRTFHRHVRDTNLFSSHCWCAVKRMNNSPEKRDAHELPFAAIRNTIKRMSPSFEASLIRILGAHHRTSGAGFAAGKRLARWVVRLNG